MSDGIPSTFSIVAACWPHRHERVVFRCAKKRNALNLSFVSTAIWIRDWIRRASNASNGKKDIVTVITKLAIPCKTTFFFGSGLLRLLPPSYRDIGY